MPWAWSCWTAVKNWWSGCWAPQGTRQIFHKWFYWLNIRLFIAVKLRFFKLPFTYYSVCAHSVSAVEGIGCWRITVGVCFFLSILWVLGTELRLLSSVVTTSTSLAEENHDLFPGPPASPSWVLGPQVCAGVSVLCGPGNWTQALVHAGHAIYWPCYIPTSLNPTSSCMWLPLLSYLGPNSCTGCGDQHTCVVG